MTTAALQKALDHYKGPEPFSQYVARLLSDLDRKGQNGRDLFANLLSSLGGIDGYRKRYERFL